MIHGKDIIIYEGEENPTAIAAAKSCTVVRQAGTIETSSPASGVARSYASGRTDWTVTMNSLVLNMKDNLMRVGEVYYITMAVRGSSTDTFEGTAICTECNVTGTVGNLAQGSFKFQGSDPYGTLPPQPGETGYDMTADQVRQIVYDTISDAYLSRVHADTAQGLITFNASMYVPTGQFLRIGDAYLTYDAQNAMIKVWDGSGVQMRGLYATGSLSALGAAAGSGGGGGGGDLDRAGLFNILRGAPEDSTEWINAKFLKLNTGLTANSDGSISVSAVTALGTNGNYLTWTMNGTTSNITVPFATKASQDASGNTITSTYLNKTTSQSAHAVLIGPTSGSGAPTFRVLEQSDIPSLSWTKITSDKPTTLAGYGITDAYTKTEADGRFITISFFETLFNALNSNGQKVNANTTTGIASIKAMFGFWTEQYISALGQSPGGGGGSGLDRPALFAILRGEPEDSTEWINANFLKLGAGLSVGDNGELINSVTLPTYTAITISAEAGRVLDSITVNQYGHVTAAGSHILTATDIPNLSWTKITSDKPTTLAGYGITDAYTKTEADGRFITISFFETLFNAINSSGQKVSANTTTGIASIKAMFGFWTESYISALGQNPSATSLTLGSLNDVDTTGAQNGQALVYNSTTHIWEPGTVAGGSSAWADITGKPTTIAGYGITDAYIYNGAIYLGGSSITPIPIGGSDSITGTLEPYYNNQYNLGASSYRWKYVYAVHGNFSSSLSVNGTSVSLEGHTHTASDISGTLTASQIPSLDASKITSGTFAVARIPVLPASKIPDIYDIDGFGTHVYDATINRTANTVLAGPTSGSASPATFRSLVPADIPTNISITGNAATATTATTASKLSTTSKTAWGQTYWTSGGVPTSISGDMTSVGSITATYYKLNHTASNPYLQLIHTYNSSNYNYYVQAWQGLLQLGAGSANSIKINSEGAMATPGHIRLDGAKASSSTENKSQLIFRASGTEQVAISSNTNALIINPKSDTTTGQIVLGVNGTGTVFCSSGKFGIGNNTSFAPSQKLHVDGNILATGGVTALSDMRQKSFLCNIDADMETLAKLPIFYYKWKNGRDVYMHIGTSAQEVQKVFPELVLGEEELSVNYGVLGTTLGILNSRKLTDHEQRIKDLESENKRLRERIMILEDKA